LSGKSPSEREWKVQISDLPAGSGYKKEEMNPSVRDFRCDHWKRQEGALLKLRLRRSGPPAWVTQVWEAGSPFDRAGRISRPGHGHIHLSSTISFYALYPMVVAVIAQPHKKTFNTTRLSHASLFLCFLVRYLRHAYRLSGHYINKFILILIGCLTFNEMSDRCRTLYSE